MKNRFQKIKGFKVGLARVQMQEEMKVIKLSVNEK